MSYSFTSCETDCSILSDGTEKVGDFVQTTREGGAKIAVASSAVIVGKDRVDATIRGLANLYLWLPKEAVAGDKLQWSNEPFTWTFYKSGNSYEASPADGRDFYWFDDFNIPFSVFVEPGSKVAPPKGQWNINPA